MLFHQGDAVRFIGLRVLSNGLAGCLLACSGAYGQNTYSSYQKGAGQKGASTTQSTASTRQPSTTPAVQNPSRTHGADTNPGSNIGRDVGVGVGIGAAIGAGIWAFHHYEHKAASPEELSNNGPKVPKQFGMDHFVVEGFIGPNWPVALDFTLDGPGAVQIDIVTAEKRQYRELLTNNLGGRGIAITHPQNLPDTIQTATFDVEVIPRQGSTVVPRLRVYGMGVGPKAVGSIAIDQLRFGPAEIHPKLKEPADYQFHSHSDFGNVRADFVFTTLQDNHILMQLDKEAEYGPVRQSAEGQGSWDGKSKYPGQHMLQIRAWRGLQDGGDWVVAWSPDIVNVVK